MSRVYFNREGSRPTYNPEFDTRLTMSIMTVVLHEFDDDTLKQGRRVFHVGRFGPRLTQITAYAN